MTFIRLTLFALSFSCVPSRVGPPVGHRREVCNAPDGGSYVGLLRAGNAIFLCPERTGLHGSP